MEEEKYIITHNSVMGALASCAVQQSPYPRPENLEVVLDKFHDLIKDEVNESFDKYIKKFDSWKECHSWIAEKLHSIPEFKLWNERKNGNNSPYSFSSRYSQPEADDDFIDLDALTRNVTNSALQD